jgi:hypothetical protein
VTSSPAATIYDPPSHRMALPRALPSPAGAGGRSSLVPTPVEAAPATPDQEAGTTVAPATPDQEAGTTVAPAVREKLAASAKPAAAPRVAKVADVRRPYHVGVAVGLSAGLYAISLAAVTGLQVSADRATIADRRPVQEAIDVLSRHHAEMAGQLEAARHAYTTATGEYGDLADGIASLHDRMADLGKEIASIEGSNIPSSLRLPSVPNVRLAPAPAAAPAAQVSPPKTHAKTKASG